MNDLLNNSIKPKNIEELYQQILEITLPTNFRNSNQII